MPLKILSNWWANQTNDYFERLVDIFKNSIIYIITIELKKDGSSMSAQRSALDTTLELILKTIALLSNINDKQRTSRIPFDSFYISDLKDYVDLQADYVFWISKKVSQS